MIVGRVARGLACLALATSSRADPGDPYDIVLRAGPAVPTAVGHARLTFSDSPFGVSVTADGHHRYDIHVTASGLPDPTTLGAYHDYVAWEVSTDLSQWHRLGPIHNGVSVVGTAESNKFLLVITAEASARPASHAGPTVLHGTSPSGWLQSFLTHPLFRGVSQ